VERKHLLPLPLIEFMSESGNIYNRHYTYYKMCVAAMQLMQFHDGNILGLHQLHGCYTHFVIGVVHYVSYDALLSGPWMM